MEDPAIRAAETIQMASVNPAPSAARNVNPPTSVSEKKAPIELTPSDADSIPSDLVDHHRALRPLSRRHTLPPLPDLRFEQSYLSSIRGADTWGRVTWITIRDQVLLPLVQGTLWTLALSGWRFWNRTASLSGQTLGSRVRRWWYEVNNWKLPPLAPKNQKAAAAQVEDFYTAQFSSAGSD